MGQWKKKKNPTTHAAAKLGTSSCGLDWGKWQTSQTFKKEPRHQSPGTTGQVSTPHTLVDQKTVGVHRGGWAGPEGET